MLFKSIGIKPLETNRLKFVRLFIVVIETEIPSGMGMGLWRKHVHKACHGHMFATTTTTP